MNFSEALALLRQGYSIKRKSWKKQKLKIVDEDIVVVIDGQPWNEVLEMESYDILALDWIAEK